MPRKNNRPDAKRDENEPEIFNYLTEHGYKVERINNPGDLLIWNHHSRHWVVLEVKMPDGRYTKPQQKYREDYPDIDIPTVREKESALMEVEAR